MEERLITGELSKVLEDIRGLVIYRDILKLEPIKNLERILEGILEGPRSMSSLLGKYSEFLHSLILNKGDILYGDISWAGWVLNRILLDENPFSLGIERGDTPSSIILEAAKHDLKALKRIALIPLDYLIDMLKKDNKDYEIFNPVKMEDESRFKNLLKDYGLKDWSLKSFMKYYKHKGTGCFSRYKGFYWDGQEFSPIKDTDPITLDGLVGYDRQKNILVENTEKFLKGYPANNVLLYGDRGTGKSSMVKALIHEYGSMGLRIIELPKAYLSDYHRILKDIEERNFKFILFVDDLSFEDHETEYKDIKALLEGGLKVRPSNILVYSTSNRRHIVRELEGDRHNTGYEFNAKREISPTDSMQEKLSLADRFGITLTFIAPNQKGYIEIIEALARERGIDIETDELYDLALKWERRYNGRSGRTAKQFIDDLEGILKQ